MSCDLFFFSVINKEASLPKIVFHGVYSPDSNLRQPLPFLLGSTRVVGSLGLRAFWVACMWKLKFEQEKDNYSVYTKFRNFPLLSLLR